MSVASRRVLRSRLRRAMVSRSAARASSFEGEGGFRETRGAVDASSVAGVLGTRRRVSGTGAAGPGRGSGPLVLLAELAELAELARLAVGGHRGQSSRAPRRDAAPAVRGGPRRRRRRTGAPAGASASSRHPHPSRPRRVSRSSARVSPSSRDGRRRLNRRAVRAFCGGDAPRHGLASLAKPVRARRRPAGGGPGPERRGPASSSRARSPQSVPGDVHAALARLRTSAIAARPAGVEAGVGSPNPRAAAATGADGTRRFRRRTRRRDSRLSRLEAKACAGAHPPPPSTAARAPQGTAERRALTVSVSTSMAPTPGASRRDRPPRRVFPCPAHDNHNHRGRRPVPWTSRMRP